MGRDHSERCQKCGVWFGGLDDTPCACGTKEQAMNPTPDDGAQAISPIDDMGRRILVLMAESLRACATSQDWESEDARRILALDARLTAETAAREKAEARSAAMDKEIEELRSWNDTGPRGMLRSQLNDARKDLSSLQSVRQLELQEVREAKAAQGEAESREHAALAERDAHAATIARLREALAGIAYGPTGELTYEDGSTNCYFCAYGNGSDKHAADCPAGVASAALAANPEAKPIPNDGAPSRIWLCRGSSHLAWRNDAKWCHERRSESDAEYVRVAPTAQPKESPDAR